VACDRKNIINEEFMAATVLSGSKAKKSLNGKSQPNERLLPLWETVNP
jgi:hypothetical protein